MKKSSYKLALFASFTLLLISLCFGIIFLLYKQSVVYALAEEQSVAESISEYGDFEDDSVIIILKSESSRFRGICNGLKEKIYSAGGKFIKDLSELPECYVNNDGSINKTTAPNLFTYYKDTPFKQILYVKLLVAGKKNVVNAICNLQKLDEVDYVGPNWVEEIGTFVPNDTYYSEQWALNSDNGINAEAAWGITRGKNSVRVGIIDSGISSENDLSANIETGFDFYNDDTITDDPLGGHGTHVAGIVGAIRNNNLGISGVAPNIKLVPLQTAHDTSGSGSHFTSERLDAINYAIGLWEDESQRISILNHSIGGFGTNTDLLSAINNFPGLFVWSAGNTESNTDEFSQIGKFALPNVISVGALNPNGKKADYSNYGQNSVDIYAPGSNILSTFPSSLCSDGTCKDGNHGFHLANGYHYLSGTSMAAPHVTGVAALLLSLDSTLTGADLKEIILDTADHITISTPSGRQTVKKLNAYYAVSSASSSVRRLFGGGTGTDTDPFLIRNETHLKNIVKAYSPFYITNFGYVSRITYSFKLMNDITVSGDWTPPDKDFAGRFDGNYHSITYSMTLTQEKIKSYTLGFFGKVIVGAEIKNLTMKNCSISNQDIFPQLAYSDSDRYVAIGILAGSISSPTKIENVTIQNCTIDCNVKNAAVGAIAGWFSGANIINCHVSGGSLKSYDVAMFGMPGSGGAMGGMAGYGDVYRIEGGSISNLTITKNNYRRLLDKIGEVIGDFLEENSGEVTVSVSNVQINKNLVGLLAEGSLITLADGSQVPVESLKGDELLLVWNLYTGEYDVAPILFIDSDPRNTYKVIHLSFSDGTSVEVIPEHGFYDYNLNRYVYLDENAAEYLGTI